MSLLKALGLPVAKTRLAAEAAKERRDVAIAFAPSGQADGSNNDGSGAVVAAKDGLRFQSTVTIRNDTGSDIRLLGTELKSKEARFVTPAPPVIAAHGRGTFRVIAPGEAKDGAEGSARYHIERKKHSANVTFQWTLPTGHITLDGDEGPFSGGSPQTSFHPERGHEFLLSVQEEAPSPEDKALQFNVAVHNRSGFGMTFVSSALEDPEHTEFNENPASTIKNGGLSDITVQALDEEHTEGAGNVVYRVDELGKPPHLARMRWRKGATPVGSIEPNDGAFVVKSKAKKDDFVFEVLKNDGPPPAPPGPTKVTIVNNAGFTLKRELLQLDNEKTARFKSEPATVLGGGRNTVFEVEAPDPEFPDKSGIVGYDFKLDSEDPDQAKIIHSIAMDWRSEAPPSFAKVSPPADGVDVKVDGGNSDNIVFTVTGPELEFKPPDKVKQPTLRKDDKSADGWVEYLQEALNHHLKAGLEVDGVFGGETHKFVIKFQEKHKKEGCMVDGVVGDQTWSFLREGVPEKPKTDGRKPHSFVEKGLEARWVREQAVVRFEAGQDALVMQGISVGDTDQIQGRQVRIRITNPDGVKKVMERPIGPGVPSSKTGQGFTHDVKVEQFATLFDETAKDGPPPGDYTVEAFFDAELGNDKFLQVVTIARR